MVYGSAAGKGCCHTLVLGSNCSLTNSSLSICRGRGGGALRGRGGRRGERRLEGEYYYDDYSRADGTARASGL